MVEDRLCLIVGCVARRNPRGAGSSGNVGQPLIARLPSRVFQIVARLPRELPCIESMRVHGKRRNIPGRRQAADKAIVSIALAAAQLMVEMRQGNRAEAALAGERRTEVRQCNTVWAAGNGNQADTGRQTMPLKEIGGVILKRHSPLVPRVSSSAAQLAQRGAGVAGTHERLADENRFNAAAPEL